MGRAWVLVFVAVPLLVGACGGGSAKTTAPPSTIRTDAPPITATAASTSTTTSQPLRETAAASGRPPTGPHAAAPERAGTGPLRMRRPGRPCRFLTVKEWESAIGASGGATQDLEHGNACGYTLAGATAKLAVAVLPVDSKTRWLSAARRSRASTIATLPGALVLRNDPTPDSDTLVRELDGVDVVFELSTSGDHDKVFAAVDRLVTARAR